MNKINGRYVIQTREDADELIEQLVAMKGDELRELWEELFGFFCYSRRLSFIRRRLEWRINTLVSGGLSERAQKRAEEIMDETLLRIKVRRFRERRKADPERVIRKIYRGQEHELRCYGDYVEYGGMRFGSLSAAATHIAGYHTSGSKFFGVYVRKGEKE